MKEIRFTEHALLKISILEQHGITISQEEIKDIVYFPDSTMTGYKERAIAQKNINEELMIRIIYEEFDDYILIVTLYPARRSRYENDSI